MTDHFVCQTLKKTPIRTSGLESGSCKYGFYQWYDDALHKRWISFVIYVWFLYCWCLGHKEGGT